MARDRAEMHVERIPSIISDILHTSSLSRTDDSNVHIFDKVMRNFSRQNCTDMPPLLLTEEDRQELQRDRQNAMKCEELLTRRKQEQYFDLVDKVQNVLQRIEEKNSLKSDSSQSEEKQIYNSTYSPTSSDFNNNPSPKHPAETHVENIESFTSSKPLQRDFVSSNIGEPLNWKKSRLPIAQQSNSGRYSLPANFETMYQCRPFSAGVKGNGGIGINGLHSYSDVQRPLSAYSDRHIVYGNRDDRYFDSGGDGGNSDGGLEPVSCHHPYLHQIPLSVTSDHQHLYSGTNGYISGPESFQQPWNHTSAYIDYQSSYANNSGAESNMRQPEMPQNTTNSSFKPGHSSTIGHSSIIDHSPILPQSTEGQSSISKQRELLALEQKRLEEHYASLQGQLLADFQRRQEELIQVYNKNLETQSGDDQTMQSILGRSFESDSENTIVRGSADEENFTLLRTDELPQSPFGISVKKSSTSIQKSISPNVGRSSRSFQNSASNDQRLEKSSKAAFSGRIKRSARSSQSSSSPNAGLLKDSNPFQKSTSPAQRFTNNSSGFRKAATQDQRFTDSPAHSFQNSVSPVSLLENSISPPNARLTGSSNTSDQRYKSTAVYSLQNSASSDVGLPRKSFNSEVSAQEYYDIPHFGDKSEKSELTEQRKIGNRLEREVGRGISKDGVVGKDARKSTNNFAASVITSPKRTQLSSFESQAIKHLKNTQSHKFFVLSAHAKGFLTRLLFQTAKINGLITTVKDAKSVLAEMNTESSQSMTDRSFKERVKTQLHSAQSELCRIFVDSPPHVRMQILEKNRRLLQEKKDRNAYKVYSSGSTAQNRPKLSNVTMKKRLSRQENQVKTPKMEKAGTPNSSKISPITKERSTAKYVTKNTSTTSKAKTTPKIGTKTDVLPMSNAVTDTAKGTDPRVVTEETTATAETNTTSRTSERVVTTLAVTKSTPLTTATIITSTRAKPEEKRHDTAMSVKTKPSVKSTKASAKVVQTSKSKRRTWDTSVLKPIQGRISPTIPTDKTRSSNEKRQSTLSNARKVGQKLLSEYQSNGLSGQSSKCEVSGIDMGKTYKVCNKPEQPVKKTGARRSLAANLSHK